MISRCGGIAITGAVATIVGACQPAVRTSGADAPTPTGNATPPPSGQLATATTGEPLSDPTATRGGRRATIEYTMHGKAFPLPIVKGTIAGQPVRMMLDTGANSHILAGWFVRKAGLPAKKLGGGTDHAGTTIETFRVEKPEIAIDDWGSVPATSVVATEVPKAIEKLGVAAFLSPQALGAANDAVVLDLVKAELRAAPWEEAKAELGRREGWVPLFEGSARLCEQTSGAIHVLSYVIPAFIQSQRVSLLVDTGAQHSDIFTSSAAGKKLAPQSVPSKEAMFTAAGGMDTRILEGASVSTGTFATKTDVDLIGGKPDAWCPRDGVVAMDLLRSCALLLGKNRLDGRCEKK